MACLILKTTGIGVWNQLEFLFLFWGFLLEEMGAVGEGFWGWHAEGLGDGGGKTYDEGVHWGGGGGKG